MFKTPAPQRLDDAPRTLARSGGDSDADSSGGTVSSYIGGEELRRLLGTMVGTELVREMILEKLGGRG